MLTKPHQKEKVLQMIDRYFFKKIKTRFTQIYLDKLDENLSRLKLSFFPSQMAMEIDIHRKLNHKHVVGFHCFFEDENFIYILLEICRKRVRSFVEFSCFLCCLLSLNLCGLTSLHGIIGTGNLTVFEFKNCFIWHSLFSICNVI